MVFSDTRISILRQIYIYIYVNNKIITDCLELFNPNRNKMTDWG